MKFHHHIILTDLLGMVRTVPVYHRIHRHPVH